MKKVKIESKTCVSKDNLFWTNMDPELVNSIECLQNELDNANSKITELANRVLKAIEFINSQSPDAGVCGKTIKKILKGSDK